MLTLLLTVGLSILFGIFATQNTSLVVLSFYKFSSPQIPVYLAILIPIILTVIICSLIQVVKNLSSGFNSSRQKNTIKRLKRELAETVKELHKKELEIARSKAESEDSTESNSI